MSDLDDRLEHLISRRLDGEITQAEEHELNKMLIRSPEAQRLLEVCERQDRAVGSVLSEIVRDVPARPTVDPAKVVARRRRHIGRWLVPLAVAAVVTLAVGVSLLFGPRRARPGELIQPRANAATTAPHNSETATVAASMSGDESDVAGVEVPHQRRRATSRDVFGVVGEDGQTVYLFEMNRTRTTIVPVSGQP